MNKYHLSYNNKFGWYEGEVTILKEQVLLNIRNHGEGISELIILADKVVNWFLENKTNLLIQLKKNISNGNVSVERICINHDDGFSINYYDFDNSKGYMMKISNDYQIQSIGQI